MKMFSRLSLLTLICLGFVVMLVGNTAYAQIHEVNIVGLDPGTERVEVTTLKVGDEKPVTITVRNKQGNTMPNVLVTFRSDPANAASFNPASQRTNALGMVTTMMKVLREGKFKVHVTADEGLVGVGAKELIFPLNVGEESIATKIIVSEPSPSNPLQVGSEFTSAIQIKNVENLAAWKMDVVFNPMVLEFVSAAEGNFLEQNGEDTLFFSDDVLGKISLSQARVGRTVDANNALVLNPNPDPASRPAGVSGEGELVSIVFRVKEFAEESLGLHNVQLSDSTGERISYYAVINPVVATHMHIAEDVNRDGILDVRDLIVVAGSFGKANPINPRADVNDDGIVDVLDIIAVASHASWGKSVVTKAIRSSNEFVGEAPLQVLGSSMPKTVQGWIDLAQVEDDGSAIFDLGIANLEALLSSRIPSQTRLLLNYPNPFNPETWIPYQLAEATDVTVTIHAVNGTLIRTLALGHQAAGIYQNKSQAAYWDGRNEFGEQVASGLYFYTLTAGNFSATGKMLVRK